MSEAVDVERARELVLAEVGAPLGAEPVPLEGALGRVLAQPVVAGEDVPGFDNSAMDGFAVRAADTAAAARAPVRLALRGESRAGAPFEGRVEGGEAIAISTGAALPAGADAVVRLEEAAVRDGEVELRAAVEPGRDVRRAGEDVRAGSVVLEAGTELGPAELGVLASLGVAEPRCTRAPRLAVLCTGDELLGPDEPMRPGGVRDSNAYTLPALAARAGARLASLERVADDAAATREALAGALASDVVVCCGGVSVGRHDHVKDALAELGVAERFWRVALRPGKPTWFGLRERPGGEPPALVFGLPGNPVSAFVTFVLFVRPALRALLGAAPERERVEARLARAVPRLGGRDQALRCRLRRDAEGWLAEPTGPQGSHVLTSMLGADGLALIRAGQGEAAAGTAVPVEVLRA